MAAQASLDAWAKPVRVAASTHVHFGECCRLAARLGAEWPQPWKKAGRPSYQSRYSEGKKAHKGI
eukprot:6455203-Amphidinium_carterae.1